MKIVDGAQLGPDQGLHRITTRASRRRSSTKRKRQLKRHLGLRRVSRILCKPVAIRPLLPDPETRWAKAGVGQHEPAQHRQGMGDADS